MFYETDTLTSFFFSIEVRGTHTSPKHQKLIEHPSSIDRSSKSQLQGDYGDCVDEQNDERRLFETKFPQRNGLFKSQSLKIKNI